MRRFSTAALGLLALLALPAADAAVLNPTPPAIEARSYILQDYDSGRVLVEVNADEPLEPSDERPDARELRDRGHRGHRR